MLKIEHRDPVINMIDAPTKLNLDILVNIV